MAYNNKAGKLPAFDLNLPVMSQNQIVQPKVLDLPNFKLTQAGLPNFDISGNPYNPYKWNNRRAAYQREYLEKHKTPDYVANYNDDTQLNSVADIIYRTISGHGNPFIDTLDLIKTRTLAPLAHGDFKAFGLNALVNFSETMDLLANPVKGLLAEGMTGLKQATGFTSDGRRHNYDIDIKTGNKALDLVCNMAVEALVDPVNWITFGVKAAGSTGVKATSEAVQQMSQGTAKEVAGELGEAAVKDAAGEVSEAAAKEVASGLSQREAKALARQAITHYLYGDADSLTDCLKDLARNYVKVAELHPKLIEKLNAQSAVQGMRNILEAADELQVSSILKGAQAVNRKAQLFEKLLINSVGNTTLIRPTFLLAKTGYSWADTRFLNKKFQKQKPMADENGNVYAKYFDTYLSEEASENVQDIIKHNMAGTNPDINIADKAVAATNTVKGSINSHITTIESAITQNAGQYNKAYKAISEALAEDTPTLDLYISRLKDLNTKYPGKFDAEIARLQQLNQSYKLMQKQESIQNSAKVIKFKLDNINTMRSSADAASPKKIMNVLYDKADEELNNLTKNVPSYKKAKADEVQLLNETHQMLVKNKLSKIIANTNNAPEVQKLLIAHGQQYQKNIESFLDTVKTIDNKVKIGDISIDESNKWIKVMFDTLRPDDLMAVVENAVRNKQIDVNTMYAIKNYLNACSDDMLEVMRLSNENLQQTSNAIKNGAQDTIVFYKKVADEYFTQLIRKAIDNKNSGVLTETQAEDLIAYYGTIHSQLSVSLHNPAILTSMSEQLQKGKIPTFDFIMGDDAYNQLQYKYFKEGYDEAIEQTSDKLLQLDDTLKKVNEVTKTNDQVMIENAPERQTRHINDILNKVNEHKPVEQKDGTLETQGLFYNLESYNVTNLDVTKDSVKTDKELKKILHLKEQDCYDPAKVQVALDVLFENFTALYTPKERVIAKLDSKSEAPESKYVDRAGNYKPINTEYLSQKLSSYFRHRQALAQHDYKSVDEAIVTEMQSDLLAVYSYMSGLLGTTPVISKNYKVSKTAPEALKGTIDYSRIIQRDYTDIEDLKLDKKSVEISLEQRKQSVKSRIQQIKTKTLGQSTIYRTVQELPDTRFITKKELRSLLKIHTASSSKTTLNDIFKTVDAVYKNALAPLDVEIKHLQDLADRGADYELSESGTLAPFHGDIKDRFASVVHERIQLVKEYELCKQSITDSVSKHWSSLDKDIVNATNEKNRIIAESQQEIDDLTAKLTDLERTLNSIDVIDSAAKSQAATLISSDDSLKTMSNIKSFMDKLLEDFNTVKKQPDFPWFSEGALYYLKQENSYATYKLCSLPSIMHLADAIENNTELGALLNLAIAGMDIPPEMRIKLLNNKIFAGKTNSELLEEIKDSASIIVKSTLAAKNYRVFRDAVLQSPLNARTKGEVLSSVEKLSNLSVTRIAANPDYYTNKLISAVEAYDYSTNMIRKENIEKLLLRNPDIKQAVDKRCEGLGQHASEYDVIATAYLYKKLGIIPEGTKNAYVWDIETTGLNPLNSEAVEISVYDVDNDTTKTFKFKNGENPNQEILDSKFPDMKTTDEQLKAYKAELATGNSYDTEQDMFTNFLSYISGIQKNTKGAAQFYGHNIDTFDKPYLTKRLKQVYSLNTCQLQTNVLDSMRNVDGFKKIKEADGIIVLNPNQKQMISNYFMDYVNQQCSIGSSKLVAPIDEKFIRAMNEITTILSQQAFIEGSKYSKEFTKSTIDLLMEFKAISKDVVEAFNIIGDTNQLYKNYAIATEDVPRIIERDKKLAREAIAKIGDTKDPVLLAEKEIYEHILSVDSDDMNINVAINGWSPVGINAFGVKKMLDYTAINKYFRRSDALFPDTPLKWTNKDLLNMHHYATIFNKSATAIKNQNLLKRLAPDVEQALAKLIGADGTIAYLPVIEKPIERIVNGVTVKETEKTYNGLYKYVSQMIMPPDTQTQVAMLSYIYNMYKKDADYLTGFYELFSDKLRAAFDNPDFGFFRLPNTDFEKAYESLLENSTGNPEALTLLSDALQDMTKYNVDMCQALDAIGANTARAFVETSAVQEIVECSKEYKKAMEDNPKDFTDAISNLTNAIALQETHSILALSAEDLVCFMANHNTPLMTIPKEYIDEFKPSFDKYKEVGLKIAHDTNGDTWIIMNKNVYRYKRVYDDKHKEMLTYLNNKVVPTIELNPLNIPEEFTKNYPELSNALSKAFDKFSLFSDGTYTGLSINPVRAKYVKSFFDNLPKEIKDIIISPAEYWDNFYKYSTNLFVLGDVQSRNLRNVFYNKNVFSSLTYQAHKLVKATETRNLYLSCFMNDQFAISSAFTAVDVQKYLLEHPGLVACKLIRNSDGKVNVEVFKATSLAQMQLAIDNGAKMLPITLYSKGKDLLEDKIQHSQFYDIASKILQVYKIGYLASEGLVIRNFIDSFVKTAITTQSLIGTIKAYGKSIGAQKYFDEITADIFHMDKVKIGYLKKMKVPDDTIQELLENAEQLNKAELVAKAGGLLGDMISDVQDCLRVNSTGRLTKEAIDYYFDEMHPEKNKQLFLELFSYFTDEASDAPGILGRQQKNIMTKNLSPVEKGWHNLSNAILKQNGFVETTIRLAEFISLRGQGKSMAETLYYIEKTHFDYSTDEHPYLKFLFPFMTFAEKNLAYWLDILEQHPEVYYLLEDLMEPIFDLDGTNSDDAYKNNSINYRIMNGNPVIGDNGLTFKLNASVMDLFNFATSPVDAVTGKLFGPVKTVAQAAISNTPLNGTQASDMFGFSTYSKDSLSAKNLAYALIPFGNVAQRWRETGPEYVERTGNPLNYVSSIFGAVKTYQNNYTPKQKVKKVYQYTPRTYYKSSTTNYYPMSYTYYGGYSKRTYAKQSYDKNLGLVRGTATAYRPGGAGAYRSNLTYPVYYYNNYHHRNFYYKHYSKKGKSRMQLRMLPVTSQNLKYRIKDYYYYFK